MSEYNGHFAVAIQAGLVAWVLVELAKRWFDAWDSPVGKIRDAILRSLAVVIGAVAGGLLGGADERVEAWPVGVLLGVAAGGLCAWAVRLGKQWLARRFAAGVEAGVSAGVDAGIDAGASAANVPEVAGIKVAVEAEVRDEGGS